jgi:hypothetical protein
MAKRPLASWGEVGGGAGWACRNGEKCRCRTRVAAKKRLLEATTAVHPAFQEGCTAGRVVVVRVGGRESARVERRVCGEAEP